MYFFQIKKKRKKRGRKRKRTNSVTAASISNFISCQSITRVDCLHRKLPSILIFVPKPVRQRIHITGLALSAPNVFYAASSIQLYIFRRPIVQCLSSSCHCLFATLPYSLQNFRLTHQPLTSATCRGSVVSSISWVISCLQAWPR